MGKVFKLPVHKIPFTDKNSNGTDIRMIIKNLTSNINTVMYEPVLKDLSNKAKKFFISVTTSLGNIKKLDIEDFLTVPPSGIIYNKLSAGDTVKNVSIVGDKQDIVVYSRNKALRMSIDEIPHQKRNNVGQRAMISDAIDGVALVRNDTTDVIVITESGKVNRLDIITLPNLGRNKTGSNVIKLAKGDSIKCILTVNSEDIIRIITRNERLEIPVNTITQGSSISTGNKLVSLKNDNIISCNVIKHK
jgi:DNA gyrase subunit A